MKLRQSYGCSMANGCSVAVPMENNMLLQYLLVKEANTEASTAQMVIATVYLVGSSKHRLLLNCEKLYILQSGPILQLPTFLLVEIFIFCLFLNCTPSIHHQLIYMCVCVCVCVCVCDCSSGMVSILAQCSLVNFTLKS